MNIISTKKIFLLFTALLSLLTAAVMLGFKDDIFNRILSWQMTIKEGSAAYNAFVETPIPVMTSFYFFDILNPRKIMENHEKPILKERGPYTFRETQRKVNIRWNPNGTVTYQRQKYWYFERSLSVGPLTDLITTINLPVVSAAEIARGNFFMEWGVSDMLSSMEAEIFVRKTVGELLFEGYEDKIIDIGSALSHGPGDVVLDKFGWFYKRNGTTWADGEIEMRTGQDDINALGEIVSWNHANTTQAYEGDCSKLQGSAEGLLPPGMTGTSHSISIYSTDLCRPLHFTKTGKDTIHGVPVNTFELDPANFANTTKCTDNHCYNNNLPSGVQNVTQCKMKSPVFVSRPHFYQADPSYLQQFQTGLQPSADKHNSVLWVEPVSSIPGKINMRLQLNILLKPVEGINLFRDVQEVMFPVLWFESLAELPEGSLDMLLMLPTIIVASLSIIIVTCILIIVFIINCQNMMCVMKGNEKYFHHVKHLIEKNQDYFTYYFYWNDTQPLEEEQQIKSNCDSSTSLPV